jgi:hypothetical protein
MKQVNCTSVTYGRTDLPAPAVRASFYLPRIKSGWPTTFILDSGSDSTCIHGQMAYKLQSKMLPENLDYGSGVGGIQEYYFEKGIIIFRDLEGAPFEIDGEIKLAIQKLSEKDMADNDISSLPSIIGRDILSNGEFIYNWPKEIISLCFPNINTKPATAEPE